MAIEATIEVFEGVPCMHTSLSLLHARATVKCAAPTLTACRARSDSSSWASRALERRRWPSLTPAAADLQLRASVWKGAQCLDELAYPINVDGHSTILNLRDTGGPGGTDRGSYEDDYAHIRPLHYAGPHVSVAVCIPLDWLLQQAETCLQSFWLPERAQHARDKPFILVGTKADLRTSAPGGAGGLTLAQGQALARRVGYLECAALQALVSAAKPSEAQTASKGNGRAKQPVEPTGENCDAVREVFLTGSRVVVQDALAR